MNENKNRTRFLVELKFWQGAVHKVNLCFATPQATDGKFLKFLKDVARGRTVAAHTDFEAEIRERISERFSMVDGEHGYRVSENAHEYYNVDGVFVVTVTRNRKVSVYFDEERCKKTITRTFTVVLEQPADASPVHAWGIKAAIEHGYPESIQAGLITGVTVIA